MLYLALMVSGNKQSGHFPNPSAPGLGQPDGLTYPFPKGFDSPHWRYWKAFAHQLRNNPVNLSVLAEMLAEYQQYRDNVISRGQEN